MRKIKLLVLSLLIPAGLAAQSVQFTRQDTLRGSVTPEREWWDLSYYHLSVRINPADSTLGGQNLVRYRVLKPGQVMQIDLQDPLSVSEVTQSGKPLKFRKEGNAWFISLDKPQVAGEMNEIIVRYGGRPQVSKNPPWSGGLSWRYDKNDNPFVVTTCQGDGASLWWPCRDHQADEPDSMLISVTVPEKLTDVSNGRLRKVDQHPDGTKTFHWFVSSPINNYGVNVNVASYEHFSEQLKGESGMLDCDYYVLPYNLEKARSYFAEVKRMLDALEFWFGPYPFYRDGFKLVEVPYPGMEHQSSVTYGNGYKFGYGGGDVSGTGWGLKFDFIILHESSHEWFGNSITSKDIADMWVHESFGAYSETLFVDYHFGKEAGNDYCIGTRKNIGNRTPVVGPYGVNRSGSGDMYSKGANMLHTIRQLINDDSKFRAILRGLGTRFYHQTVTGEEIENFISAQSGINLKPVFDQYLRHTEIPILEYTVGGRSIRYRWTNCIDSFNMRLKVAINGKEQWIHPSTEWTEVAAGENPVLVADRNFYIQTIRK